MLGMSRAAERIGFRTRGVKVDFETLRKDAPLPCMVHWNQNHFIAVYKITRKKVYIADAGAGKLSYNRARHPCGAHGHQRSLLPAGEKPAGIGELTRE
jgi:ATP-binding cassette, subfamily B, bacterial